MSGDHPPHALSELLVALRAAASVYQRAKEPREIREVWLEEIRAIFRFINGLGLAGREFAFLTAPLTDLAGALEDLDRGTQPPALLNVSTGGRGKKHMVEIAALAPAAAVIDQLMADGVPKKQAVSSVTRDLKAAGVLPPNSGPTTVSNFRRDLEKYGDEAIALRRVTRAIISRYDPAERQRLSRKLIRDGLKLRNPDLS